MHPSSGWNKRQPARNKYTTQERREAERGAILSLGVFEGVTTGTADPADNRDTGPSVPRTTATSRTVSAPLTPRHLRISQKTASGINRGGGRSSAKWKPRRVVACSGPRTRAIKAIAPKVPVTVTWCRWVRIKSTENRLNWGQMTEPVLGCPRPKAADDWAAYLDGPAQVRTSRLARSSRITARGVPAGLGAPVYASSTTRSGRRR